ncbi:radical SAM protein [Defluviitalea raffinosedens]|uniref:radical SAM protein n=1 Tax=Defluviitalea raffinosedens TaxID=1450156 RepID=UPI00195D8A6C|nr:radical SAM protein [Defluviitalea raffinosedens]MBM7686203.1 putative pyruvate formate lyase activating enzyme [Defluviitalea raffinosedens]
MDTLLLKDCTLCPRNCHVDRFNGQKGYCKTTYELVVARAALHMWEEPCISGEKGSGTVFFSGCAMGCVYCQNYKIAQGLRGKKISIERLAEIFLELQEKNAHNINLVTPSHYVPQIIEAISISRKKGMTLPVVYNSSGYEKVETLKLLEGYVDVYLPDLKYYSREIAKKYSNCEDYFSYASKAIIEMVKQVGAPAFDENGMMKKGVIVRHLALPGYLDDSKKIIQYLYETFGDQIFISIMNQYTPMETIKKYPELNHKITEKEYEALVDYAIQLGVENGFIQEGETASESFIPEFNEEGV